jgi:hypothetical protein
MEINFKKHQKFKLKSLLQGCINFIESYKSKNILIDEINKKQYDQLSKYLNEFINNHLAE